MIKLKMPVDEKQLREIEAVLMVMDVTIYCLQSAATSEIIKSMFEGQIAAAKEAYESLGGDSMIRERA